MKRNPFGGGSGAHKPVEGKPDWLARLQNPAVAGGISAAVLLVAVLVAWGVRARADRRKAEAASGQSGTECSFVGAGVAFTAPGTWKLTKNADMTFEFRAPEGAVSVTVLQVSRETHLERARTLEPGADWRSGDSELPDADFLSGRWTSGGEREGNSWLMDRPTHRLWITAVGSPGIREALKPLFKSLTLTAPAPPPGIDGR